MTPRWLSGMYLLRRVPMDGKYIPTHASNKKKLNIRTYNDAFLAAITEPAIAAVAVANIPVVKVSVGIFPINFPNKVDPNKQLAMKQENTVPYGVEPDDAKAALTALLIAGGHCNTNIYIAASKRDCTAPTNMISGFEVTSFHASLMVGLLLLPPDLFSEEEVSGVDTALFSVQSKLVKAAPAAKKPNDNLNGPVGPLRFAAAPASCPAKIATIESPAYA